MSKLKKNKDKGADKNRNVHIQLGGDNDDSTSISPQEESEEANLCLMGGYKSSSSSQVSSLSLKDKNYYHQLLHAFEEMHDESNMDIVINNRLRDLNT